MSNASAQHPTENKASRGLSPPRASACGRQPAPLRSRLRPFPLRPGFAKATPGKPSIFDLRYSGGKPLGGCALPVRGGALHSRGGAPSPFRGETPWWADLGRHNGPGLAGSIPAPAVARSLAKGLLADGPATATRRTTRDVLLPPPTRYSPRQARRDASSCGPRTARHSAAARVDIPRTGRGTAACRRKGAIGRPSGTPAVAQTPELPRPVRLSCRCATILHGSKGYETRWNATSATD